MTKEQALAQGYRWRDPDTKNYVATIQAEEIPSDITTTSDSATNEIFECSHKANCNHGCTKAFRIIPDELSFYKKIGIPLPTLCPACRTMERLEWRHGFELFDRTCNCAGKNDESGMYANEVTHQHGDTKCTNTFKTGFDPDKGDIVYCESCYQQEVE